MESDQRKRKKRALHSTAMAVICIILICTVCTSCAWKEEIPFRETGIEEVSLEEKYYYQQLNEEERQAYKEIAGGIREQEAQIYVHAADAGRTNTLFQYVLKDFPEFFWCDGTTTSTSYEGEEPYTVLVPVYLYDGEQREEMQREIDGAVEECLQGVPAEASDYQKILYVYEYIVNTVDYDLEAENNQNIYSVFCSRRSVCAGYSKAAQYLLERLGVFCTYVTGTTTGGQNHAWNLVLCSGSYYYVDTTWGDPVFQAGETENVPEFNYISYDYLCCNDAELFKTHTPDQDVTLPVCSSMDENYYVVNGMYYTAYDSDEALKKMNETIAGRGSSTVLKFADENLYRTAHDDIFQNVVRKAAQNLAKLYGLEEVKYQYMDEPKLNKITIYWKYE